MKQGPKLVKKIAIIGTYIPSKCGIATFTHDLSEAIMRSYRNIDCNVLPVLKEINDTYSSSSSRVKYQISLKKAISYIKAADYINKNNIELVLLQHEYGIFGGAAGSYILMLLRNLNVPVVTTLHTILRSPDPIQYQVLKELNRFSDRLVVMCQRGVEFLQDIYGVPREKIDYIPHGIPDFPRPDTSSIKHRMELSHKLVLLSFGLLSPNKGIEKVIMALPRIICKYPEVVYIVVGETHPNILEKEGEFYREKLEKLAIELKVKNHLIFHNMFVSEEELKDWLSVADIIIFAQQNHEQIVSGTLSYAVGAGKPIVSTPSWYTKELSDMQVLVQVPNNHSYAIAEQILDLIKNDAKQKEISNRSYLLGKKMAWGKVASHYMKIFNNICEKSSKELTTNFSSSKADEEIWEVPTLNLDHFRRMTDGTGMLQHAVFSIPNYSEGYSTDDIARALIATTLLEESGQMGSMEAYEYASKFLAFLWYAFNPKRQRMRNFLSYDRCWLESVGSETCHGRALWALGTVIGRSKNYKLREVSIRLFDLAIRTTLEFKHTRAWAFAILGFHEYLKSFPNGFKAFNMQKLLCQRLLQSYKRNSTRDWPWFEDTLTFFNAKLPHALLLGGQMNSNKEMIDVATATLDWLVRIQYTDEGHFAPVGNDGFYSRGGEMASFDQQPVETHAMVSACHEIFRLTGKKLWCDRTRRSFKWFLGFNQLGIPIYDPETGGCCDGLQRNGVNQNQGSESTLSYILSFLEIMSLEKYDRQGLKISGWTKLKNNF